jgi:hypothetical protein
MTDEPKDDPGTAPDTSWLQTREVREGDQRREKAQRVNDST